MQTSASQSERESETERLRERREIMERLHSAKSTGGSIRNIWVWGGQGGFCLQAVHWLDTSPRLSPGVYTGGGRWGGTAGWGWGVWSDRERCLLFCRKPVYVPRLRIYHKRSDYSISEKIDSIFRQVKFSYKISHWFQISLISQYNKVWTFVWRCFLIVIAWW